MFSGLFSLISLVIAAGVGLVAFGFTREYVRNRLRFVDAVRNPIAPWLVGFGALILAAPVAALLPLVTGATAALFGAGAGFGTASGVKALKRGE